ncbi:fibronectin type III domain-containing protein [Agrococcus jejuensis]|uniref:fibronectin type III domain-containing protein n=1 Tax=Agrococcus jejuensis TaxID=399736 RepID=UPI0011A16159|nr:fibronectin type III domain-containing protein [Agrococcus jejuensis]
MAHAARTASVRTLRSLLAGASAVAVALGGLVLAPAPAAQAASTIDQQNPRSAVDFVFDAEVPFEETQTFTAGRTGLLDAVDFDVYEIAAPGTTITATLSAVGGSAPIAGSGSAQVLSTGWLHIPISQPPTVRAGSTYMVTFTGSGSGIVRFSTNENYPGGISGGGDDLVFRTYVDPGTPPGVSGTLPRAIVGQYYTAMLGLGGTPRPTVRVASGSLPPGVSLSSDGIIAGQPSVVGRYDFTVEASNQNGIATFAASIVVDGTAPGSVRDLAVRQEGTSVVATWSPPIQSGGAPVTYVVRAGNGPSQPRNSTSFAFPLAPGETVRIWVAAVNQYGQGPETSVDATRVTAPSAPAAPTVVMESSGVVRVTWQQPALNGAPLQHYVVQPMQGGTITVAPAAGTSILVPVSLGMTHQFRVAAVNAAGQGPFSQYGSVYVPATPGAPTGLVASTTLDTVRLDWVAPFDAYGTPVQQYVVERLVGGVWVQHATVPGSRVGTYVTGLPLGEVSQLRVRAQNISGLGQPSTSVSVQPMRQPDAPTGLETNPGDGTIDVAWMAPAEDGGSAITSYLVQYRVGAGAWIDLPEEAIDGTYAWITDLANGVEVQVRVAARNDLGLGAFATVTATPLAVPGQPIDVVAVGGDRSIALTWAAPTDDGGVDVIGYLVQQRIAGGEWTDVSSVAGTELVLGDIANGTRVELRVAATNEVGTGPWSTVVTAIPHTLAAAPTWQSVAPHAGGAVLTWTAPDGGGLPIDWYVVELRAPGGDWSIMDRVPGSQRLAFLSNLVDGVTYEVRVHAVTGGGDGAFSAVETFTPRRAPDAPTSIVATPGSGSVGVTWSAPAFDGGAAITGYVVEHREVGTTEWTALEPVASTSASIASLENGTAYEVRVAAVTEAGRGLSSEAVTVVPRTVPDAPTGVVAVPASQAIAVEWDAPAWDGGAEITDYALELHVVGDLDDDGQPRWVAPASVDRDGTTAVVSGLVDGLEYEVRVAAVNAAAAGAWSATASATPRSVPDAPATLEAAASAGAVTLTWSAPASDGGARILSWAVEHRIAGTQEWTTPAGLEQSSATGALVSDLADGTAYEFRVAAVNVAGAGAWSDVVTATPSRVSDAVEALAATVGDGVVTLHWDAPAFDGGSPIVDHVVTATIDGAVVPAGVAMGADGTSAIVSGLTNGVPVALSVAAVNANGVGAAAAVVAEPFRFAPILLGPDGSALEGSTLRAGDVVDVRAAGLPVGAVAVVELHSTPIELGRGVVDADGVLAMSVTIPAGVEPGAHEIVVRLEAAGAETQTVRTPVSIAAPIVTPPVVDPPTSAVAPAPVASAPQAAAGSDGLPRTGVELLLLPMLLAGAALVLGGAAVRRRSSAR